VLIKEKILIINVAKFGYKLGVFKREHFIIYKDMKYSTLIAVSLLLGTTLGRQFAQTQLKHNQGGGETDKKEAPHDEAENDIPGKEGQHATLRSSMRAQARDKDGPAATVKEQQGDSYVVPEIV
jgi:hypothetical protein